MKGFEAVLEGVPFERYFVNRERELRSLLQFTAKPGSITYVCGPAGIGKTALLNVFAVRHGSQFPGGWKRVSATSANGAWLSEELTHQQDRTHRLVIMDDAEYLSEQALSDIAHLIRNQGTDSLIVSLRTAPQDPKALAATIVLGGLSLRDMIEARLKFLPDAPGIDRVLRVIEGNPTFFNVLLANPRNALEFSHMILRQSAFETEPLTQGLPSSQPAAHAASPDPVSIILAIVLFLLSYFSSERSTDDILDKIESVQQCSNSRRSTQGEHLS